MSSNRTQNSPQQSFTERAATVFPDEPVPQSACMEEIADTAGLQAKLALALRTGGIGLWEWNARTQALNWDTRMYEIYGLSADTPITSEIWKTAIHPEDLEAASGIFSPTVQQEIRERHRFRIVHPRGGIRWIEAVQELVLDEQGNLLACIGCDQDVSERMRQTEAQKEASAGMALSAREIPNESTETDTLHNRLDAEIARMRRYGGRMSLLLAELDHFGQIVEHFGEQVGELFLRTTAETIEGATRSTDQYAGAGNNLFALMLPGTGANEALALSRRIGKLLAQGTVYPLNQPLSISFGVAQWENGEDTASLRRRALKALHQTQEAETEVRRSVQNAHPPLPARALDLRNCDWQIGFHALLASQGGRDFGTTIQFEHTQSREPASPPPYN